jgi:hypothetical protein
MNKNYNKIRVNIFDILFQTKIFKLNKALNNYKKLYERFVKLNYKNDSKFVISQIDFDTFYEVISMNCHKDYIDSGFKDWLDLDIDFLVKRRIYRVTSFYDSYDDWRGIIARDFKSIIEDLNLREEFKSDKIDLNINMLDVKCPYP